MRIATPPVDATDMSEVVLNDEVLTTDDGRDTSGSAPCPTDDTSPPLVESQRTASPPVEVTGSIQALVLDWEVDGIPWKVPMHGCIHPFKGEEFALLERMHS